MKTSFIALFVFTVLPVPGQILPTSDKTIGHYKKFLSKAEIAVKKIDKLDTYKAQELKHKRTGDVKKFSDFSALDQRVFIFFQVLKLEQELSDLQEDWE